MKTTATNRKIHQLITSVRDGSLVITPAFQRRLVWKNKDKCNFIETVLDTYPFPEIYVATGDVDLEKGEGTEVLVDGQQRVSTLIQYFSGSDELKLGNVIPPYSSLPDKVKNKFLQYDVVVRDLGALSDSDIRDVFQRINSTGYSLNAMEINNSRFDGEFKATAEKIAEEKFFSDHRIFNISQIRRMDDTRFILGYLTTVKSTYFNRDNEIERFLEMYDEEFQDAERIQNDTRDVLSFIENCNFDANSRVWRLADTFTLMVETYWALKREGLGIDRKNVARKLRKFYTLVDQSDSSPDAHKDITAYHRAALQGSNSRTNRITRGRVIAKILRS